MHTGNADYIHDHLGSRAKEIVRLQRSYHVISLDNDLDLVVDRIVRFVRKVGCARDAAILQMTLGDEMAGAFIGLGRSVDFTPLLN